MPNNMSTTIGIMFFFPLICNLVAATVTNRNTNTINVDAADVDVDVVVVFTNLHNFICWYYIYDFFYYEISSFMTKTKTGFVFHIFVGGQSE